MKQALLIIFIISAVLFAALKLTSPGTSSSEPIQMPWQVTVIDPEHVEVFGLVLNQTTLGQAVARFGLLEDVAIYRNAKGEYSLEAYLGKVSMGPLTARLITNLSAAQDDLEQLSQQVRKRTNTENGSDKWVLSDLQKEQQMTRAIVGLTYIPQYSGMQEALLLKQFGEPERRKTVDETSELWFYPAIGVRILVDQEGREVFEYRSPADFSVQLGEAA